jgi:hypothetical protein
LQPHDLSLGKRRYGNFDNRLILPQMQEMI